MKLINDFDNEINFENLEDAKKYYLPENEIPCILEEYLGDDYESYCIQYKQFKADISNANSLIELADILNTYSDIFLNGSEYTVRR